VWPRQRTHAGWSPHLTHLRGILFRRAPRENDSSDDARHRSCTSRSKVERSNCSRGGCSCSGARNMSGEPSSPMRRVQALEKTSCGGGRPHERAACHGAHREQDGAEALERVPTTRTWCQVEPIRTALGRMMSNAAPAHTDPRIHTRSIGTSTTPGSWRMRAFGSLGRSAVAARQIRREFAEEAS